MEKSVTLSDATQLEEMSGPYSFIQLERQFLNNLANSLDHVKETKQRNVQIESLIKRISCDSLFWNTFDFRIPNDTNLNGAKIYIPSYIPYEVLQRIVILWRPKEFFVEFTTDEESTTENIYDDAEWIEEENYTSVVLWQSSEYDLIQLPSLPKLPKILDMTLVLNLKKSAQMLKICGKVENMSNWDPKNIRFFSRLVTDIFSMFPSRKIIFGIYFANSDLEASDLIQSMRNLFEFLCELAWSGDVAGRDVGFHVDFNTAIYVVEEGKELLSKNILETLYIKKYKDTVLNVLDDSRDYFSGEIVKRLDAEEDNTLQEFNFTFQNPSLDSKVHIKLVEYVNV